MDNETQPKSKLESKKTKRIALIVTMLITMLGLAWFVNKYIIQPQAKKDTVTVAFEPSNIQSHIGENFNVNIRISASNEKKISAIDLSVKYNGNKVKYQAYTDSSIAFITVPNDYFTQRVVQDVSGSGSEKKVRLVLVAKKPAAKLSSNVYLSLKFKALKTASGSKITLIEPISSIVGTTGADELKDHTFSIDSADAESTVTVRESISCNTDGDCKQNAVCAANGMCACKPDYYNCDGDWTNGCESKTVCLPGGDVSLKLKLKLQGIDGQPKIPDMNVRVSITGGDLHGKKTFSDVAFKAKENGIYIGQVALANVNPGNNYRVLIKAPKHMQKRFCVLKPTGGTRYKCSAKNGLTLEKGENIANFIEVPQLVGDLPLPQDGILNAKDIKAVKDCIGSPNADCINKTDVNYDGATNGMDFSLMQASMELKYDDED